MFGVGVTRPDDEIALANNISVLGLLRQSHDPLTIFSSVGAWRMRPALSIDWHTLLEEDLVAHFVVLPIYQEDETLLRETLENLGPSPATENTSILC